MRYKNAIRKHYVAPYTAGEAVTAVTDEDWLLLAQHITTTSNEADENVEETAYYDGDGTPEEDVTSVKIGKTFEGFVNREDPAQKLILDMAEKIGTARKVWYKEVSADGKRARQGLATVTAINDGDGEASEFEAFACTIKFDRIPEVINTPAV